MRDEDLFVRKGNSSVALYRKEGPMVSCKIATNRHGSDSTSQNAIGRFQKFYEMTLRLSLQTMGFRAVCFDN